MASLSGLGSPVTYHSRFANWDSKSSVRSSPRRIYAPTEGLLPFPPELVPSLLHPAVARRGDAVKLKILAERFFAFLHFTEYLERKAVIPVCTDLSFGDVPFLIPYPLRRDASRILVDEAHHAECAGDLNDQVTATIGLSPDRGPEPAFLQKLHSLQHRYDDAKSRSLAALTFCSVSETLITGILTKIPDDERVISAIRRLIMDHALDEAKHYACFAEVIHIMWSQLSDADQNLVGPLFAECLAIFLAPDLAAEAHALRSAGFDETEAARIVQETYAALDSQPNDRAAAKPLSKILKTAGVLANNAAQDAFAARGFL